MPRIRLTEKAFPPPGRLIDVGACSLHIRQTGAGLPTVVLEAGIGATSLSWALVEPALSKTTSVFSYDRAGLGWSGPAVTPRIPSVIAGELKRALECAKAVPPYVLVGHSFGGLVVQRFALDYPELVKGVVLVDPLSPFEWQPLDREKSRRLALGVALSRRGAVLARLGIVGGALGFLLSGNRLIPKIAARLGGGSGGTIVTDRLAGEIRKLPRELWPSIAFHWSQPKNFEGMAQHLEMLPESSKELAEMAAGIRAPVTLIVAERAVAGDVPPGWKLIRAEGSGHWVQLDRPDLVIDAVKEMAGVPDGPTSPGQRGNGGG